MRLRWSETAAQDIIDLYDFGVSQFGAESTVRVMEGLFVTITRLEQLPKLGRSGRVLGTREWVISPFIVVYRLIEDVVQIETIFHGRRRYP